MRPKKHAILITTITALGMIGTQSATAAIVLFDDFDGSGIGTGDGTSVNGGFQLVGNSGHGTGTVGETPSDATIATAANSFNNSGIVSISSIAASAATSISSTWVVTSQNGGGQNFNATELLLQGGTGFRGGTGAPYIEFVIESNGQWNLSVSDGVAAGFKLFDGPHLGGGFDDGYTVTMELDATGWEVTGADFGSPLSQSGAWSGGFDFTDLQTDLYAAATIQAAGNNTSISLNVDSISVDVVPEPSSFALLGLGSLGFLLRRRRA